MNSGCTQSDGKLNARFRSRFQRRMADYWLQRGSAAEGFGAVWEKTLEEVPVGDEAQGQLYHELIHWAKNGELFAALNEPGQAALCLDNEKVAWRFLAMGHWGHGVVVSRIS